MALLPLVFRGHDCSPPSPRGVAYNPHGRVPLLRADSGSSAHAAKGSSSTASIAVARSSPSGT